MPCPVTGMTKSKPIAEVYYIQYNTTCKSKIRQVLRYSFYVPAYAVRPLAVLIATGHMWVNFYGIPLTLFGTRITCTVCIAALPTVTTLQTSTLWALHLRRPVLNWMVQ